MSPLVRASTHTDLLSSSALVASLLLAPLSAQGDAPAVWFEEAAAAKKLVWSHVSGAKAHPQPNTYWFPEIMGSGAAVFDYDGDGDLDVYLVQSGYLDPASGKAPIGNRLFQSRLVEDGALSFVDVTEKARVGDTGYGMGCACGDYDQDGDIDLYVTNVGPNKLFQNQGDGTFLDVTNAMKVGEPRWGTSAAFFDADIDGDLDLFVVNNLNWSPEIETPCVNYRQQRDYCSPNNYNQHSADVLFLQGGRLGFQDYSRRVGLHATVGNGLGVAVADYDRDGLPDVYIANDATANALWHNLGGRNGFADQGMEDVAPAAGCAVNGNGTPEAGMGVQWVDLDQDGWLDLFMTHLRRETNTYYRNNGKGRFRDMTRASGLGAPSLAFTGFGMGFHDFDQDGQLDLYVANGAVQAWGEDEKFAADPYAEPNHLYRGLGESRFKLLGEGTAAPLIGSSRGAAFGDLDQDGDVDIVVVDRDAPVKLLLNIAPKRGGWIGFAIKNKRGATDLGSLVKLRTKAADGTERAQWRLVDPAYSYLSSNDERVVFGVPEGESFVAAEVWRLGAKEPQTVVDLALGAYHVVRP